jgi:hypothetical protein
VDQIVIKLWLILRVQKLLNGSLVPLFDSRFELIARGAKAGAPVQVRYLLELRELLDVGTANRHTKDLLANTG